MDCLTLPYYLSLYLRKSPNLKRQLQLSVTKTRLKNAKVQNQLQKWSEIGKYQSIASTLNLNNESDKRKHPLVQHNKQRCSKELVDSFHSGFHRQKKQKPATALLSSFPTCKASAWLKTAGQFVVAIKLTRLPETQNCYAHYFLMCQRFRPAY